MWSHVTNTKGVLWNYLDWMSWMTNKWHWSFIFGLDPWRGTDAFIIPNLFDLIILTYISSEVWMPKSYFFPASICLLPSYCFFVMLQYLKICKVSKSVTYICLHLELFRKMSFHISNTTQNGSYHSSCCGHQIGLIYFIQYFQLVFLWNAFGRPTGVFHGRFTWYLNGILEFCICLIMT